MKRTFCTIALGLLLASVMVACNSDKSGTETGDEAATSPAAGATEDLAATGDAAGETETALSATAAQGRALTLTNSSAGAVEVYLVFTSGLTGNGGTYTDSDFNSQGCQMYGTDRCKISVPPGPQTLTLDKGCINISGGLGAEPMGPCPTTMFEINFCDPNTPSDDNYDVSLVNGYNHSIQITPTQGTATAHVTSAKGNQTAIGVFPLGCSVCIAQGSVPPAWEHCPGNKDCSDIDQCFDASECKSVDKDCVLQCATGGAFTVAFGDQ